MDSWAGGTLLFKVQTHSWDQVDSWGQLGQECRQKGRGLLGCQVTSCVTTVGGRGRRVLGEWIGRMAACCCCRRGQEGGCMQQMGSFPVSQHRVAGGVSTPGSPPCCNLTNVLHVLHVLHNPLGCASFPSSPWCRANPALPTAHSHLSPAHSLLPCSCGADYVGGVITPKLCR